MWDIINGIFLKAKVDGVETLQVNIEVIQYLIKVANYFNDYF